MVFDGGNGRVFPVRKMDWVRFGMGERSNRWEVRLPPGEAVLFFSSGVLGRLSFAFSSFFPAPFPFFLLVT